MLHKRKTCTCDIAARRILVIWYTETTIRSVWIYDIGKYAIRTVEARCYSSTTPFCLIITLHHIVFRKQKQEIAKLDRTLWLIPYQIQASPIHITSQFTGTIQLTLPSRLPGWGEIHTGLHVFVCVFQAVPGPASYGNKYAMSTTVRTKTPRIHGLYFSAEYHSWWRTTSAILSDVTRRHIVWRLHFVWRHTSPSSQFTAGFFSHHDTSLRHIMRNKPMTTSCVIKTVVFRQTQDTAQHVWHVGRVYVIPYSS